MIWVILLVLTIVCWGSVNLFYKALESPQYFYALMIMGLTQSLIAIPFLLFFHSEFQFSAKNLLFPVAMGLLLGIGTILFFYTFKFGAQAMIAIPVYTLGAFIIGILGSYLFFNEKLTIFSGAGLVLGIASILILILDGMR